MSRVIRLAKRLTPPAARAKIKGWLGEVLASVASDHHLIARTDAMAQLIDQRFHTVDAETKRLDQAIRSAVQFQRTSTMQQTDRTDRVVELLDQRLEALRLESARLRAAADQRGDEIEALAERLAALAAAEERLERLEAIADRFEQFDDAAVGQAVERLEGRVERAEHELSPEVFVKRVVAIDHLHELRDRIAKLSDQLKTSLHENRAALALRSDVGAMNQRMTEASTLAREAATVARRAEAELKAHVDDTSLIEGPGADREGSFRLTESDYREFERQFRGGPSVVVRRLRQVTKHIPKEGRVLDVGCGSGVLVKLLRDAGVDAMGVDSSRDMVDACRASGQPAECADAIEFLRSQPEGAFDTIVSVHMIEHLSFNTLCEFVGECFRVLPKGGRLVLESPNVESLLGWSRYYTLDPTHREPRHPALVRFLCDRAGFSEVLVDAIHPPAEQELLDVPEGDGFDDAPVPVVVANHTSGENGVSRTEDVEPAAAASSNGTAASGATLSGGAFAAQTAKNFEKLNSLLFVGQDYLIRGTK